MKNFKQIILPAVIVLMGTGAAFATNKAKKAGWDPGDPIYRIDSNQNCVLVTEDQDCSTDYGTICTTLMSEELFGKNNANDTSCPVILYKNQ
ncbi:DUF6520 family protein [Empedobacter falsenii]|uniref:Secreted protein n=1 Tax=Empedobacter falsenii TaxID=343874 RepID=A0AAW7DHN6_9FLAO|nr:DUF6520 family protein [Empedobacter falsenii]MDM1551193.1 hypothetical protein [Empedobacter falsenii]